MRPSTPADTAVIDPAVLIAAVERIGYGARLADRSTPVDRAGALRRRLVVAVTLGATVLVLSMIPALQFAGWQWVVAALATPVAVWAAWPFHRAMVLNARHGQFTMDTLISIGVIAAYLWSMWALLFTDAGRIGMTMPMEFSFDWSQSLFGDHSTMPHGESTGGAVHGADHGSVPHLYFEVASTVVAFLLAGRYFEARAKRRAGDAVRALLDLGAREVVVIDDGVERSVPIEQLAIGDRFVVRPGERVATDAVVESGRSAIDNSLVTGESLPVEVGPGDAIIGATINEGGRLIARATRVGADTQLAQMARLVEEAQSGKAPVQRLADRVSAVFVPVVMSLSVVTFVLWMVRVGDTEAAFAAAVAVLIIACPCALGLATPTALLVGTGRGAQMGILIRGPEVLESTRRIDTVVLDKTGTVTTGTMSVVEVVALDRVDAVSMTVDEILRLAGAVEAASEHPIGRAIAAAARDRHGVLPEVDDFVAEPGAGVHGRVEGHVIAVGRDRDGSIASPDPDAAIDDGHSAVTVSCDDEVIGRVIVADTVKADSRAAVERFRALGLRPVLLTGDQPSAAEAVARAVGIDDVRARVLPADKVAVVAELRRQGRVVAMVGDGVNDAAALIEADLGIAMGSGTDIAIEASDLTLVRSDLTAAVDAVRLSRRTLATIRGNLFWAFAYNAAAIPLAMLGLLSPLVAGAAMAFSSVFVVTNSLRLRRFR